MWNNVENFVFAGDFIGKLLAIASLMPMAIIAGFITLIMFRRDLHTVCVNFFTTTEIAILYKRTSCCWFF